MSHVCNTVHSAWLPLSSDSPVYMCGTCTRAQTCKGPGWARSGARALRAAACSALAPPHLVLGLVTAVCCWFIQSAPRIRGPLETFGTSSAEGRAP